MTETFPGVYSKADEEKKVEAAKAAKKADEEKAKEAAKLIREQEAAAKKASAGRPGKKIASPISRISKAASKNKTNRVVSICVILIDQ